MGCMSILATLADTSTIRPLGLIRHLDVIIGGYTFQISAVVLQLDSVGAYPLLLGRPWLKTANIKQNWNKNVLTFRKGKSKIRFPLKKRSQQVGNVYRFMRKR